MSKDSALKKIKDFFVTQLSEQEQSALKDFVAPVVVTLKEVKSKDGKVLSYDGELIAGTMVNEMVEGNAVPAEGAYELEDGSKLMCVAGKVTEVVPMEMAAPAAAPNVAPIVAAEVATQMSAHKELQDKEIKVLKEQVITLTKIVNTILETEITFNDNQVIDETKLSAYQKFKLNRDGHL